MNLGAALGLGLAAWLAAGGVAGADETRAQLEQRVRLAERVLGDASMLQRIAASGNAQARAHLDEGQLHRALAEEALQRADLQAARRNVDEALRHAGMARRLAPDTPARQAALRQRYAQQMAALERLVQAWAAQLPPPAGDALDGDLYAARELMSTAGNFADQARHEEAVHTLAAAERHVLTGMRHTLGTRELDYTQRADTPAQEYALELLRHQGLLELLPLAVAELRPQGEAAQQVDRHGETSRTLRAQAQQQYQGGDTVAALAHIRSALLYAQRALQAAGVTLPPSSGNTP